MLPESRRSKALKLAHEFSRHSSVRGMKKILNGRFNWPGIGKDISDYVKSCPMQVA